MESKGISATAATPLLLSAYMARADTAITEVTFQVSQTVVSIRIKRVSHPLPDEAVAQSQRDNASLLFAFLASSHTDRV